MAKMLVTLFAGVAVSCSSLALGSITASATSTAPTTTTLQASTTSSRYDSFVTFTAQVSSSQGSPEGSVTFSDTSNGSVLDTVQLIAGSATFATAALADGQREIVAAYGGSSAFSPSQSAAVAVKVAPAGSPSLAYQVDARHDGHQTAGSLNAATLTRKWQVTLGGAPSGIDVEAGDVSYPVIAGGRVFVTVENTNSYGTQLYALDARTGSIDWSVGIGGTYGFSALAYDGREIFCLNFDGVLTEFSARTGHENWSEQLPRQWSFTAPPTAYDGVVYVSGAGDAGTVYAVSEADGLVRWTATVANGDKSSPAVDDTGAFVSYACQQDYAFSLAGNALWHHSTSCEGGGGSTAVLHGSRVYVRGAKDTPIILSEATGASLGTFASNTAPAFDSTNMYTIQNGDLVAVAPSGSPNRWTFRNGSLVTAPIVDGGTVFVGSSAGDVYGLSASSGGLVWTGVAGSSILGPDEQNADVLVGMAAGGGLLVVPAANQLSAFGG